MSLSRDQVNQIAHLSRLAIEPGEVPGYVDNLSRIIDFVARLDAADTQGTVPMAHPVPSVQRLRRDEVTEQDQHERYQENAQSVQDGLYLVPRVIE